MPLFGLPSRPDSQLVSASKAGRSDSEQADAAVEAIAGAGLTVPALLGLRALRPLSWLGGQMLWVLEPLLGTLGSRQKRSILSLTGLASLLEREEAVDEIISGLEATGGDRRA